MPMSSSFKLLDLAQSNVVTFLILCLSRLNVTNFLCNKTGTSCHLFFFFFFVIFSYFFERYLSRLIAHIPCLDPIPLISNFNNYYITSWTHLTLLISFKGTLLYWCDAYWDRIESVNLLGGNRRLVFSTTPIHPFDLILIGNDILWTDWYYGGLGTTSDGNSTGFSLNYHDIFSSPMGIHYTGSEYM